MKIYFRLFFVSLLMNFLFINITLCNELIEHKFIVKVKPNTSKSELANILDNHLKNYNISTFISPENLKFLSKKLQNHKLIINQNLNDYKLKDIYLIEFMDAVSPIQISNKLKSYDIVDYSEPMFERNIFYENYPNDSLLYKQYYLMNCKVFEAIKLLKNNTDSVIIGVVDTGVDYTHEDLKGQMYNNKGETGLDSNGNDKTTNKIDDDNNGYIDDWMGWDFGSSDSLGYDNDPIPGNAHGTHVSGIITAITDNDIGIAGINPFAKILPVKIGGDSPWSRNLVNSYDGLLYAGLAGSQIINCSWGGGGFSQAEQDVVNQVISLGSVIVAAAGNNYENGAFYPASYKGVVSVAALTSSDTKANFSNYHYSVDVAAPGVQIMSTIPINEYIEWDGTSMASPVAAAIAGFIRIRHPEYSPMQVGEHLKATTDNIDSLNPFYLGQIGRGRVNAYKALTDTNLYSLNIENMVVEKTSDKDIIESGDRIRLKFELFNTLKPLTNVVLTAKSSVISDGNFIKKSINCGNFQSMENKIPVEMIELEIPVINNLDFILPIDIKIISDENFVMQTSLNILINPSYRTLDENNIKVTVTSKGNIGYNDYPSNLMGDGFVWNNSSNILFEGALIVGIDSNRISDVARAANAGNSSNDFEINTSIKLSKPGNIADLQSYSVFNDVIDTTKAGIKVLNSFYQFNNPELKDVVFAIYDIINQRDEYIDSLFTGLYFDWDIGPGGASNQIIHNSKESYAYCYNTKSDTLPIVGVTKLSKQISHFYAIDNDGNTNENPGVYDGFSKSEKWKMISGLIKRDSSGIKDVSMIAAAGPVSLRPYDTTRIVFAIFASKNVSELSKINQKLQEKSEMIINLSGDYESSPKRTIISNLYPNPVINDDFTLELMYPETEYLIISIFDINGKLIGNNTIFESTNNSVIYPGIKRIDLNTKHLSQGEYFLKVRTSKGTDNKNFIIIR